MCRVHTHFGSSDEEDEAQAVSAAWTPLKTLEVRRPLSFSLSASLPLSLSVLLAATLVQSSHTRRAQEARAHDASAVDDIAGALEGCKVAEDL